MSEDYQDYIERNWKKIKGTVKKQWGKLTDDDLLESEGKADLLVAKLAERYRISEEEANEQWDEFVESLQASANHIKSAAATAFDYTADMAKNGKALVEANPLISTAIAVGLGFLFGSLLPHASSGKKS